MKGAVLALLVVTGCARALTAAETEMDTVGRIAQYQACVSPLRISRSSYVYHYRLGGIRRADGSISYPRSAWYDIDACNASVRVYTLCGEHHGTFGCSFDIGDREFHDTGTPPPRTQFVAEIIAVFDHAQLLFSCSLLDVPIRIDRREVNHEVAYEIDACANKRAFRVSCPEHGSVDPDDCRVTDR